MSEFKRWYIGVYGGEAQARGCFPHTREIIRESEGATFALASELEASLAREAALQERLTAADERADVLEGLVRRTLEYFTEPGMPEDLLAEFKAALARVATTCTWQYAAFSYHTGCGQEWMLNDGTPEQNGMRFCHSCGKTLVVEETGAETEKDDDWRMNPCKQGHSDVGAAGGVAACNECEERIEAPTTQEAFERWNATHPML